MKNLLFIITIVFGAFTNHVKASNFNSHLNPLTVNANVYQVNLLCVSIAKGDTIIVKKLIENGENVNKKSNGLTPAMYAAKYNRVDILKFLIARGANLKTKSSFGYTALEYAKATNAKDAQKIIEDALLKK